MKKILIGVGVIASILMVLGGGFLVWLNSLLPASEERISFRNDHLIKIIDDQLKGIDIEAVKSKSQLIEQKSIKEIQDLIKNQKITYEELVAYYLINIKEKDQSPNGNNAVSEVNPGAIDEARAYDSMEADLPLKGIPVLVKENINTSDMPTSSGMFALKDFIPSEDAPVIKELKENGAILLGKTNLSELSNWMSQKNPSGYSAKKGQTHNPFDPINISPLGSSAGSAVAMATDLASVTLGTETVGSIVAPAAINSTVGYKPTRDRISGEKVIPITLSLDTVGVIGKHVEDTLITSNAATKDQITVDLDRNAIVGKRIGVLGEKDSSFSIAIRSQLQKMGVEVVDLGNVDTSDIDAQFILQSEFEHDLNAYLVENNAPIKSLKELIEYNKQDPDIRMRYGQTHLESSLDFKGKDDTKVKRIIDIAQKKLIDVMDVNNLDAIVCQDNDGVILTAVAGAPQITVPFGKNDTQPIGATFSGKLGSDDELFKIAYSFEQQTNMRLFPNQ